MVDFFLDFSAQQQNWIIEKWIFYSIDTAHYNADLSSNQLQEWKGGVDYSLFF